MIVFLLILQIISSEALTWVQGGLSQTCSSTCTFFGLTCAGTGYWPLTLSDFTAIYPVAYDSTKCSTYRILNTCSKSVCPQVAVGNPLLTQDPEGDGNNCYYGGGAGTCDAIPDGSFRRFCPCSTTASDTPSCNPTKRPTGVPSILPSSIPSKIPTLRPSVAPNSSPLTWVQGGLSQTCSSTCTFFGLTCAGTGYWPLTLSDFTAIYPVAYDSTKCSTYRILNTCSKSVCPQVAVGNPLLTQDPEGDGNNCYYGGGAGTCDAIPDGSFRRFCPCLGISALSLSPTTKPTTFPTRTISSFYYTGSIQYFIVPDSVHTILVDAYGAQGGTSSPNNGGFGGYISAVISVIPGETLYIYIGGQGLTYTGGYNGGGNGQCQDMSFTGGAGGGGGATDIRRGGTSLSGRVVVAGGGGGAGYDGGVLGVAGGAGGGIIGGDGGENSKGIDSFGGKGGSQTSGGTGGYFSSLYNIGLSGYWGVGGVAGGSTCGGGGGGGYYGGGGGSWTGGGGGSSYSYGDIQVNNQAVNAGNGYMDISVLRDAAFVPTASPSVTSTIPTLFPVPQPTTEPSLSPSTVPTKPPTVVPSRAPTVQPTMFPSRWPTSSPTVIPSRVPTSVPTHSSPVIGFNFTLGLSNITTPSLSAAGMDVIVVTTASTMNIRRKYLSFLHTTPPIESISLSPVTSVEDSSLLVSGTDQRLLEETPTYFLSTLVVVRIPSVAINPLGSRAPFDLGTSLVTLLDDSVASGSLASRIRTAARQLTVTELQGAVIASVMITNVTVILSLDGDGSNDQYNDNSKGLLSNTNLMLGVPLSIGVIMACVCVFCCLRRGYHKRHFVCEDPERRGAENNTQPPVQPIPGNRQQGVELEHICMNIPVQPYALELPQNLLFQQKKHQHQNESPIINEQQPLSIPLRDLSQWCNRFDESLCVGQGRFGKVYKGATPQDFQKSHQTSKYVAIKRIGNDTISMVHMKTSVQAEIRVLSAFKHPNIIRLIGYSVEDPDFCLVYDFAELGDLHQAISDDVIGSQLTHTLRIRIGIGMVSALNYLHSHIPGRPVYHRDVKSANIVLMSNFTAKLIDCGLAKFIEPQVEGAVVVNQTLSPSDGSRLGTLAYMCPWYMRVGVYDAKSEIYSLGIVLLELLTGRVQGASGFYVDHEIAAKKPIISDGRIGAWPDGCAGELFMLGKACIADYHDRPESMVEVLRALRGLEQKYCKNDVDIMAEELTQLKQQINELLMREEEHKLIGRKECSVCFDNLTMVEGVECPSEGHHFLCGSCFSDQIRSQVGVENRGRFIANGSGIMCLFCFHRFDEAVIASKSSVETYALYRRACDEVREAEICRRERERYQKLVDDLKREYDTAASALNLRIQGHILHITDNILNLKCPRCSAVFIDFEGCLALKCSACSCGFCGWCLSDCGEDAHAHLRECQRNPKPGRYYGTNEEFNEFHRHRRQNQLREYLSGIGDLLERQAVVNRTQPLFVDLGIVL